MKNRITIMILAAVSLIGSGCNKWLDVTPQAQVNADKLFSTPAGFENALYGIYTSMTDPALYGTHMTFGMMDVLAQYYAIYNSTNHYLNELAKYNYTNGTSQSTIKQAWLKAYNSIANCNILLEYLDKKPDNFFEKADYVYLYAETKALRAYLHFDMLRAFAPAWSVNPDALCLPYSDNFQDRVHAQKTTRQITALLLADLEEARAMLYEVGPNYKDHNRAYRINYWAITGLMARIYHFMGDHTNALKCAQEVINDGLEGYFTFASESALSAPLTSRDVVMEGELLFALSFEGINQLWYSYDAVATTRYAINGVAAIYPVADDFRRQYLIIKNTDQADVSVKYADVKSTKGGKIPMMRLSEMYLIAAESCFDTDPEHAIELLTTLRLNRGVVSTIPPTISREDFVKELTAEARREFLCEGQLFYWYKRLGAAVDQGTGTVTLTPAQFCLPLPSTEVEFGNRKEDYLNI